MIAPRAAVAAMVLSASALVGLALHEGYRGEAYVPVPGDVPTIGFGQTGGVRVGDKTTPTRALAKLLSDANSHSEGIKRCIKVPLHQHEFDAYSSLSYNVGVRAFCQSTLVKHLNAGRYAEACGQILRWDKFNGKPLRGLTLRRQAEHRTCMGG